MAKADGITVEVKCKFEIPTEQAERALKIVEWYMNDHSELDLLGKRNEDGTLSFRFANTAIKPYEKVGKQSGYILGDAKV